jgi:cysteinyl-tRNA synthetase
MLRIYNTLSRQIEDFIPRDSKRVTMYSCGPTVYDYQHIGHMRRYVGDDILVRVLQMNGYTVDHVMNLTDVGHLVSDGDNGEDKMEKGAKKFGMSVWDIAAKFTKQFFDSTDALNIMRPDKILKATDCIAEQISLIKKLEEKGFTYTITDGVYFDSTKFTDYGKLTGQKAEALKAGARVEMAEGKRQVTDFALWKFSPKDQKRQMEWDSPWGVGFPGWHIECSAMAMTALGETVDMHTGGIDHIPVHHTNEIAQSEAATGKQFVRYWVHHNFLQVEGQKMSKSLGNFYTVQDVIAKGFDPLALRYLYLQTHYRQEMNFTWESLKAAQTALDKLRHELSKKEEGVIIPRYKQRFIDAICDDMNMPKALAIVWELIKSDESKENKVTTIQLFDTVLGLALDKEKVLEEIPQVVKELVAKRNLYRKEKNFVKSDELRDEILGLGYEVFDEETGKTTLRKVH